MILIVYAHPEPASFNRAMLDSARQALVTNGHAVEVSDLYAMNFEPRAGRHDFQQMLDPDRFVYSREQYHAHETNTFAPDIAAEADKLRRADAVILQFPLWWYSMPAIMKGWMDRVLANGFAYGASTRQFFECGMMAGKRAMVCTTTGAPGPAFSPSGMCGAINVALWPIHNGTLRFVGFDVLPPVLLHGAEQAEPEALSAALDNYALRASRILEDEPMFFHPWSDYTDDMRLKPGVEARTVGQKATCASS